MEFDGRICVVTGAASGIGREIARSLASRGATVAILDVQLAKAEEAAGQICDEGPGSATAFACDLRSVVEIETTMSAVVERFGRVDVLVNAAGLANRTAAEDITEAEWDLLNDVNLKATFFVAQHAYRVMVAQKSGKIINIASHRATTTDGHHLVYAATKAGVQAISRDLAVAGGQHGIDVNTVSPGYVLTPMTEHNLENDEWLTRLQSRIPIGRLLTMSEVTNAVLFLASPSTSGITGQNMLVDGGWTVHE
ncbi:SDR family NAD(P)-dependent oxidoreductase [Pseudoclavibacter sp. RFBB5]|uniref:SDR family NAD(P)-dependent oxidoreductase n=1 Tax=Pseudoclavibacter sp. RFBB5 TaxID=2080574 RepID=UPI000CE90C4C|nr:SDR family oxidoreductase [Pseudoclavibacter sp. RFBB5]PPG32104.1 3-oxoacyl-ACP reductase [Pseudoclavibacter sp. RFBB5]